MQYAYPAIIYPDSGSFSIKVPDLPGCFTYGKNVAQALLNAKDAVEMWLWDAENKNEPIPVASNTLVIDPKNDETMTYIAADTDEYRKANDTRSVKKTLSIPAWLDYQAEKANAPYSQILQQGLKEYLCL